MGAAFSWSGDFQNLLLACLVDYGPELDWAAVELRSNYFTGVQATLTARCLLDYRKERDRFPTWVVLIELVMREVAKMPDRDPENMRQWLADLRQMDTTDWEFVRDNLVKFLRERAHVVALQKAVKLLQEDKVPDEGIAPLFDEAQRVGQNLDDLGFIFHADVDRVIKMVTATTYGTPTGFPLLDAIWRNGWGPGWLIVPLAPPKRYKTALCLNLACNIVSPQIAGDVLYYACEISQELAMCRAMCNLSGLSTDYLYDTPEKFAQIVKEKMQDTVAANLLFKSFRSKMASIRDIRAHAKMAIKRLNLKVRAIMIDFAETVKGDSDKNDSEHRKSAAVYTGARALGIEIGCPVIMPDRCNKETTDKAVPNMTSFQGSFEKAGIVDVALGLCSTDEEYRSNTIRLFNFLNRHGRAYQHLRGRVDPVSWRMAFTEDVPYNEGAGEERPRRSANGSARRRTLPSELVD